MLLLRRQKYPDCSVVQKSKGLLEWCKKRKTFLIAFPGYPESQWALVCKQPCVACVHVTVTLKSLYGRTIEIIQLLKNRGSMACKQKPSGVVMKTLCLDHTEYMRAVWTVDPPAQMGSEYLLMEGKRIHLSWDVSTARLARLLMITYPCTCEWSSLSLVVLNKQDTELWRGRYGHISLRTGMMSSKIKAVQKIFQRISAYKKHSVE